MYYLDTFEDFMQTVINTVDGMSKEQYGRSILTECKSFPTNNRIRFAKIVKYFSEKYESRYNEYKESRKDMSSLVDLCSHSLLLSIKTPLYFVNL